RDARVLLLAEGRHAALAGDLRGVLERADPAHGAVEREQGRERDGRRAAAGHHEAPGAAREAGREFGKGNSIANDCYDRPSAGMSAPGPRGRASRHHSQETVMKLKRAAIVSPLRTPVGAFGGGLRPVPVEELGAVVARAVVERTGIDPGLIEDVVFAQSYQNGEAPCTGRWVALQAGFPIEVAGMALDRRCGGGLQAVATAAMMVQTGAADIVMAGGVESMSNVEYYTTDMRWGKRAGTVKLHDRLDRGRERSQPVERFGPISGMIETAENLAREYNITREQADAFAAQSQQRAAAAWEAGRFADEVVPVSVPQRKGDPVVVSRDEGVRPDTTVESLSRLRP